MTLNTSKSRWLSLLIVLALTLGMFTAPQPTTAAPVELFFSEYIEGSSNNKALEIYNGTGAAVDLAAGGYSIQFFFNGGTTNPTTINLTGSVANSDVFVVAPTNANATILGLADQQIGTSWFNGDDTVLLLKGTTVIDVIGQFGNDPGSQWGTGLTSTADNTLRRKAAIGAGDTNSSDAFDPSLEWDGYATDTFDGLGSHTYTPPSGDDAPLVSSVLPADGATGVPVDSDLTVTFSEDVTLSGAWFSLSCTISGAHTAAVSGGPGAYTLNPDSDFATDESCTLNILGAQVSDTDLIDPPDTMVGDTAVTFSTVTTVDPAPTVSSTVPANGATGVLVGSNLTVTFSEDVTLASGWFTLSCGTSDDHSAAVSGGPSVYTLNPDVDFVKGESCTLTISAAQVSDVDANDPLDSMAADFSATFATELEVCSQPYTAIPAIQGSGETVALTGTQTTQGVVVGDFEGASPALRGFFIQDPTGDGNPATSDGIFVFEGSNLDTVSLGDVVRVTGTAGENQGQSQISVGTIVKCGTGTVTPTDVTFPVANSTFLEQYEGMLVKLPQTMYVTEHFQLARFGQVVLSSGARLQQPTNVAAPGAAANAVQAANDLNKIILDDASQTQNPDPIIFARGGQPLSASNTLRGGDTATGIVGVMTYTWAGNSASGNAYRVRPINALNGYVDFEATNPRPTAAPEVGGTLRVASMNTLNYFNTFTGCTNGVGGATTDCRGANNQAEFDRQWPKTVAAILAINPDVLGVNEIENDGYGANSAIATLVSQLNAATAPGTYAFIDADTAAGQVNALGTDAIKVGMIYKPAVVTPIGQTAVLNSVAFVNGGDSAPRSRPSLAQAFEEIATDSEFIVDVNHLKSKGSACDDPDAGDGQGNCNTVRVNAATELVNWLAADPTETGAVDILIMGDLNSYAMEDPVTAIINAGYTNLIFNRLGPDAYSYVFDGQWGYLDHALGSPSLVTKVSGVGDFRINADEPSALDYNTEFKSAGQINSLFAPDMFRVSDHNVVLVGLNLKGDPTAVQVSSLASTAQESQITLAWETFNEVDILGFNLYRASDPNGEKTLLVSLDAKKPGQLWEGAAYFYDDRAVVQGVVYTYWLELRMSDGSTRLMQPSTSASLLGPRLKVFLPAIVR